MTELKIDKKATEERDLLSLTDELRAQHDVVKNDANQWVLLKHADVVSAALDHHRFSSAVSKHLQVPNGLDGDVHTRYRNIIEHHLSAAALTHFIPVFERVAAELVAKLPKGKTLDAVADVGAIFAVRAQCEWLGWPSTLEPQLLAWMDENHSATRSGEHAQMAKVADKFDNIIRSVIKPRRENMNQAADDVTTRLCNEKLDGKLLTEAELVSILRNWTGGDLGSIALCVGVLVSYLAKAPALIERIRVASNKEIDAIIDEILRIDDPFVSNRRITTCPVHIKGHNIPSGAKIQLNWTSANRDETVFEKDKFDPEGNAKENIVYGIGKHLCPGRLLSTLELRIVLQALLTKFSTIELDPTQELEREVAPLGGYHRVPVILN